VSQNQGALFRGRHFEDVVIILCVRWYLRYSLSYRDLEEMMAERGLSVDHVTIWRWVQRYAPILNQRLRRELSASEPILAGGRNVCPGRRPVGVPLQGS
jgi:IS6 family transposase